MQIGIDSFVSTMTDPDTGVEVTPVERVHHLVEEVETADRVGLDSYGTGEHHRPEYLDSAPAVLQAADDFYPGWAQMFTRIGKERGFGAPVRSQYDAMCEPDGAFLIGDPTTVAAKVQRIHDDLGGIARLSLQMTDVRLAHANLLRGIELLGTEVAPRVRAALPG